jgi:hypothetical protein
MMTICIEFNMMCVDGGRVFISTSTYGSHIHSTTQLHSLMLVCCSAAVFNPSIDAALQASHHDLLSHQWSGGHPHRLVLCRVSSQIKLHHVQTATDIPISHHAEPVSVALMQPSNQECQPASSDSAAVCRRKIQQAHLILAS